MSYSNNIRQIINIKKILLLVSILLSILIFEACSKSKNTINNNEQETFEIPQIEESENKQVETIEISQIEIPKRNIYQYIKVWADGIENKTKQVKSKLIFSDDLSSLTLTLADRTVLKLKCLKPFKTNDAGEAYATYNLPNGNEIVVGYFNQSNVKWYVKFKALDGSIQEAELSNDKNAWN